MTELSDIAPVVNLPPEIWHVLAAMCVTGVLFIVVTARARIRQYRDCWMCKARHEQRPPNMNAIDFFLTYCQRNAPC